MTNKQLLMSLALFTKSFTRHGQRTQTLTSNQPLELDGKKVQPSEIAPFSLKELNAALKSLKRRKASDDSGVFGELLLDGTKTLRGMILDVFNDIISLQAYPPAAWKSARLRVIFKKGDPILLDNYRPI